MTYGTLAEHDAVGVETTDALRRLQEIGRVLVTGRGRSEQQRSA
jgi:hypothetical protein